MNKHTSGPWWFCATEEEGYFVVGAGDKELTNLISREDARLIAAAPDLLNALAVLAEACERRGIPVNAARAAIAKATGEQT